MNVINETPRNMSELEKMAENKEDWKVRVEAVHKMRKYNCERVVNELAYMALHDRVFTVKKEAYKAARDLNITVYGKPIFLGKKDTGYKLDDFKEMFSRIKKQYHMQNLDLKAFKNALKSVNAEMYDVMKYEKGKKFDLWIKKIYNNLHER